MEKHTLLLCFPSALLLLALSGLLSACRGQGTSPTNGQHHSPITTSSVTKTEYKDPLFFIEGQLCQHLRQIHQDRQGNLWMGTNVYDLMRYDGDTLVYLTEADGFSGGRVTGILEDEAGNVWFATSEGLNRYDGEAFTLFPVQIDSMNSEVWSLLLDSKGIFWVGHNQGLSRFDGATFEHIPIPKPAVDQPNTIYAKNRISSIVEDRAGHLWLGTDGYGICKYDGQTFTHFTRQDGLCDNAIGELMVDRQNRLWIGTFWGGLAKYDGEKFTNYTQDGVIQGSEVGGFFEDENGDIWFGVENNGVYQYDGSTFHHYYQEAGLQGVVLDIYRDAEDRFWFGGWGGLFRMDQGTFRPVAAAGPWE
ncbi:MAG: two-component regulator propeller domain-containing protein [Bacteroidota bacterium]